MDMTKGKRRHNRDDVTALVLNECLTNPIFGFSVNFREEA